MIRHCEVELVLKAIRRSGVAVDVESPLVPSHTGRPRALKADVFFTGAVLVAFKGLTLTLDNIHKALTEWISPSVQNALGVRIKESKGEMSKPISIRQVRYLFEAVKRQLESSEAQAPDLSPVERELRSDALQSIIDKLLAASMLQAMPKQITLAWDSSGVESWAKPKWPATAKSDEADADLDAVEKKMRKIQKAADFAKSQGQKKKSKPLVRSFDLDAHLGYRTKTYDNKSTKLFGYDLFAGVAVLPIGVPADVMPKLVLSLTLRPAAGSVTEPTLALIDRLVDSGYSIDELLADRGFSYKIPGDWAEKLHERGISQVQDIHPLDHGMRDHEGLRIVDGVPHCPKMPDHLADIGRPSRFKVGPLRKKATKDELLNSERNKKELDEFLEKIADRKQYAFELHALAPDFARDKGKTRWICPAKAGKVKCTLCPASSFYEEGTTEVVNPPLAATAPKGCMQQTVSIPGAVTVKFRQKEYWGSPEWIDSYSRRNHIESIFGNLRNPSTQSIKRGFCRVVGLVKTSFMLTFEAVAANIRLVRQWSRRTGDVTDPLCDVLPVNYGFEELDENGQISLTEPSIFDDPPDALAA